jgi:putative FmdB family regulatory protein
MLTYTYRCRNEVCEHEFEAVQKISDEPITVCPECKQETRRIIVGGRFILRGDKWFKKSGEY